MLRMLAPRIAEPSEVPGISEDHVALVEALRQLPFPQRETVVLHHLADLSDQDVADTLGVSEGTVKSRLNRARTALADLVDTRMEAEHG